MKKISDEFYFVYENELSHPKFLKKFARIIAKTEIMQFDIFNNNCQTPVAEFVYNIQDSFKKIKHPLQKQKIDYLNNDQKINYHFLKFPSLINIHFDKEFKV